MNWPAFGIERGERTSIPGLPTSQFNRPPGRSRSSATCSEAASMCSSAVDELPDWKAWPRAPRGEDSSPGERRDRTQENPSR
jgi:hypothetical protein